ncbi:MAG: ABC transporter permease [Anaerolineaceae bacterium]|nr:ABC transporter permease [Anaerolineaceae bacterium]
MLNKLHLRGQTVIAILLVMVFVIMAVFAELIAPTTGEVFDGVQLVGLARDQIPHAPSPNALLGTTPGQLDIFYALVHGSRDALIFGLITTLITALIGLVMGVLSGMRGGWINQLSMRFADGVLCFPVIAGIVFFQQVINMFIFSLSGEAKAVMISDFISVYRAAYLEGLASSISVTTILTFILTLNPVMLALILLSWVPYARMMNILTVQTQKMEFVTAAQAAGASGWRIFLRHILPNTATPLIVLISKDIGQMVVWQTTFAFVGFQSVSGWTTPLIVSRSWILGSGGNPLQFWWVYLPITLAIILFALAWNLLGDELNYWFNPRKN